ncbi:MRPL2 [Candida jiufengensis]|uniref:MRPL2 n=1 Tax=Candida jiufengensis TaxID=497108 RepID=UPI0022250854|nr:MRPL2 [Candida jiufengensis]KAI5949537.1 MRPL2 [Candida jiufengensis]
MSLIFKSLSLRIPNITNPLNSLTQIRTATKRVSGSKTSNKDSAGRRLGPKVNEGHFVKPGQIIMRQRGTKIHPGDNVKIGVDHTIYAVEPGYIRFYYDPFHPTRKYVGVSLKKDIKLPKDHFEPRLRRFGFVPISNKKKAIEEEESMSRKEIQLQPYLKKQENRKLHHHIRTTRSFREQLKEFNLDVDPTLASERLFEISQLVPYHELEQAREQVTYNKLYELRLKFRQNKLSQEEFDSSKIEYMKFAKSVDNKVGVSTEGILFNIESLPTKTETISQLKNLFESQALTKEYKAKAYEIIKTPGVFNLKEQEELKRQYLPRVLPLNTPGSIIKKLDLNNIPKNIKIQKIYDEVNRKVLTVGRPTEVFN